MIIPIRYMKVKKGELRFYDLKYNFRIISIQQHGAYTETNAANRREMIPFGGEPLMFMVLQGIHVLLGIFWFGSVLFADFVLMPTISSLEPKQQAAVMEPLGKRANRALIPVSILTIISGIILGISSGVLNQLSTAYGWTWIASITFACALFYWGIGVIIPAERKLKKHTPDTPEFTKQLSKLKLFIMLELIAIILIFIFMVLMRFGV